MIVSPMVTYDLKGRLHDRLHGDALHAAKVDGTLAQETGRARNARLDEAVTS